jgi:hypothetical protein
MTKICCVCQRVEHGSHWREDYTFDKGERVTHGYCPLCFDVIMAELRDGRDDLSQAPAEGDANGVRDLPSSICA